MSAKVASLPSCDLTQQEWENVCRVEQMQFEFHNWLRKEKKLISDEARRFLEYTKFEDAAAHWTVIAEQSLSKIESQRQTGWRYWATKYQSFATGAGDFLKDCGPLVELAQSSGPYGGLAVGTISMLFAVARSKTKTDEVIAKAMAAVKDRLPGFRMYQEIYDSSSEHQKRLRTKITLAYSGIIELATEAAKYYLQAGIVRWSQATFQPEKFLALAANVQDAVVKVREQCEELLSWNVNEIKLQNAEIKTQNVGLKAEVVGLKAEVLRLKAQIEQLQAHNEGQDLQSLQEAFELPEWSIASHQERIAKYERRMKADFDAESLYVCMRSGLIARYRMTEKFKTWQEPGSSAMLLVVGCSQEFDAVSGDRQYCWMSPFAVDLIRKDRIHASYMFNISTTTRIHQAISEVLLQLLRWHSHNLNEGELLGTLTANIKRYRHMILTDDIEARIVLRKIALTIIQLFEPQETAYIVLDRVDKCKIADRRDFLNIFVAMMEEARCCVKVFAVVEQLWWGVGEVELAERHRSSFKTVVENQEVINV